MNEDLRALAEEVLEQIADARPYGAVDEGGGRLAHAVLPLLTEKDAREVELRMLRESNTVLNERLGAAVADWEIAQAEIVVLEERAEKAEDAVISLLAWHENRELEVEDSWDEARSRAHSVLSTLEGREEKPIGEPPG